VLPKAQEVIAYSQGTIRTKFCGAPKTASFTENPKPLFFSDLGQFQKSFGP
jgi:hypothetical protein